MQVFFLMRAGMENAEDAEQPFVQMGGRLVPVTQASLEQLTRSRLFDDARDFGIMPLSPAPVR